MEIRKVQVTGGSSFMVTLPKEWAESVGLKKNDPVALDIRPDGSLTIHPGGEPVKQKSVKSVAAIDDVDFLYRQLIGAYISGHREILVNSNKSIPGPIIAAVSRFTQTSIGLEIVEEDDERILIRDLMDHGEMHPSKSIERMRVLVRNMVSDVYGAMATGDFTSIENMDSRDTEIDRLYWLVSRQASIYLDDSGLRSRINMSPLEISRGLTLARIMERIGDHAVLTSKNLLSLKSEGKADTVDRYLSEAAPYLISLFADSTQSWMKQDMDLAEDCIVRGAAIVTQTKIAFRSLASDAESAPVMGLIASSTRRVTEYCIDIAEQAINAAMD
jgi:phosphate uptake regulator